MTIEPSPQLELSDHRAATTRRRLSVARSGWHDGTLSGRESRRGDAVQIAIAAWRTCARWVAWGHAWMRCIETPPDDWSRTPPPRSTPR